MKCKVLIQNEDTNTIYNEKLKFIHDDSIETDKSLYYYNENQVKKFFNESDSTMYYLINIDQPTKQIANDLKKLRRSSALNNIFNYDVKKQFDVMSLIPYLIIIALILFN